MKNKLYIVSTPIGNYEDITLRALKILKSVDFIICEEYKPARRLLSQYEIDKELFALNEHNEKNAASEIISEILNGKTVALISDAGTPLFSDPGSFLVDQCISRKIDIIPVPGANSLLAALVGSGYNPDKFYYYGWLSPKKNIRQNQLQKLKAVNELVVIMETPYRLITLLQDVVKVFGKNQSVVVAFKLTQNGEKYYRGKAANILSKLLDKKEKGEFVLLIDNRRKKSFI
ncbi:16S rRNA (cytidine(1402)-2'-O)-methyltransferase [hydrothermal vent metagenome]|uniref:16S rRNA (Cytidine(1402)-2'-O)-methyltransferase n=1 Tax=hydrothermal vent metagenome TaxID=652676 RepID=A0A3B1CJS2_9ZZZZ